MPYFYAFCKIISFLRRRKSIRLCSLKDSYFIEDKHDFLQTQNSIIDNDAEKEHKRVEKLTESCAIKVNSLQKTYNGETKAV